MTAPAPGRAANGASPEEGVPLLVFSGRRLVVVDVGDASELPPRAVLDDLPFRVEAEIELATPEGTPVRALAVAEGMAAPRGTALRGLRQLHGRVPERVYRMAGRALQLLDWLGSHRFCGRCGAETRRHREHQALECPECAQLHFPRLAPAVIVLVGNGDQVLLGRSPRFAPGVYSALAGFVEPGESLEEAVRREQREEAGVEVEDVRYFGSQPWPFPHSLMIAFTARWAEGLATARDGELEDVRWFDCEGPLPVLPSPISIARSLIDDFLQRKRSRPS